MITLGRWKTKTRGKKKGIKEEDEKQKGQREGNGEKPTICFGRLLTEGNGEGYLEEGEWRGREGGRQAAREAGRLVDERAMFLDSQEGGKIE